jgi:hypothetical protein
LGERNLAGEIKGQVAPLTRASSAIPTEAKIHSTRHTSIGKSGAEFLDLYLRYAEIVESLNR